MRIGTVDEVQLITTRVFRDPHAWYHFVVNIDIQNATAADRVRVYVNGVRETDWSTNTNNLNGTENSVMFTADEEQYVGSWYYDQTNPFDGYFSEFVCIDGSALDPTSFGEYDTNGVWRPIDIANAGLSFGTNGFYLPFSDSTALGLDTHASATAAQAYTEFQCNFDGSDAATSATDASRNSATITFSGDAQLDTAQQKFGTASLLLDGTGDYVSIPDASYLEIGTKDFTIDCWVRFSTVPTDQETIVSKWTGTGNQRSVNFAFDGSTSNLIIQLSGDGSSTALNKQESWSPSQDTWYHVAVERTGGNVHLYVNGTQLGSGTANSTNVYNGSATFMVGALNAGAAQNFTGHVDEVRFINGYGAYQGSNFTAPTTAYATPPVSNTFTPSGSPTQSSSTPTDNHLAFSSIYNDSASSSSHITYSKGNKKAFCTLGRSAVGNMVIPKGTSMKLYLEVTPNTLWDSTGRLRVGISSMTNSDNPIDTDTLSAFFQDDGDLFDEGSNTASWGSSWQTLDTDYAMIAVETDGTNVDVWFGVNGSWQASGDPANGTSPAATFTQDNDMRFVAKLDTNGSSTSCTIATETSEFQTAAPTGFGPWSTSEMYSQVAPAIEDGTAHIQVELVSHDGTSTNVDCNWNMDTYDTLIIAKARGTIEQWYVADGVRGYSKYWSYDSSNAENTDANVFSVSGTTLTLGSTLSNDSYVIEFHKAGLAASRDTTNSDGSMTGAADNLVISANITSGFVILTYDGSGGAETVGTGLSSALELLEIKRLDTTAPAAVYHKVFGASNDALLMYDNGGKFSSGAGSAGYWNATAPTPSVFSLGTNSTVNDGAGNYVGYGWRSIPGHSAFGSYKGNGSADGPLVSLDFKPAWVMIKRTDTTGNWVIFDVARNAYNVTDLLLWPNLTNAESAGSNDQVDLLSNAVKLTGTSSNAFSKSGGTYIYAAFAEHPFAGSSPATAR